MQQVVRGIMFLAFHQFVSLKLLHGIRKILLLFRTQCVDFRTFEFIIVLFAVKDKGINRKAYLRQVLK